MRISGGGFLKALNNNGLSNFLHGFRSFERSSNFHFLHENKLKEGFTLAEVLITLGIIGCVAALTIPGLLTKCRENVIKNQFKKQYSVIQQALKIVDNELDYTPACFYWEKNPYGSAPCVERNDSGDCIKHTLANGSPLPNDYNGNFSDCALVKEKMKTVLKLLQFVKVMLLQKDVFLRIKVLILYIKKIIVEHLIKIQR